MCGLVVFCVKGLGRKSVLLGGSALCLTALVGVTPSLAQVATSDGPALEERVVVTGSRIRRDALAARDLVVEIGNEDHLFQSQSSLSEVLARLTVSGSPLSTKFNSSGNFGFPADGGGVAAGAAQVDLRHLGSKRVLVLVDGLRWVHGSSGSGVSGATDLNTIPKSAVQRIEVLNDGASAIYGSDAIAGVVNVITQQLEGTHLNASYGSYVNGGETTTVELAGGRELENTSASLHFNYVDQQRVAASAHDQTHWPKPGTGVTHGSTFTPQGRVIFADPNTGSFVNCALNEGVVGLPFYDPSDPCGDSDDYHPWTNADRFNYASFNLVLTPSTRTGLFLRVNHTISPSLRLFARSFLTSRESVNQAAPEPVWIGTFGESGSLMDDIVIDSSNPYSPFGFDVGQNAFVTRRPLESGPRVFQQVVDTQYLAAGLQGELTALQNPLFWDFNVIWSSNKAAQTKYGAHNARKMLQALGPVDDCHRISGCVPLNLSGGQGDGSGTITREMLDWIGFVQEDSSSQRLHGLSINVSGDIADLPAGQMAFAAGLERRNQRGRFDPDPVVSAGDTAGLPAGPTKGGFDVTELYAEADIPVLADAHGADLVTVTAAFRYFDYGLFDSGTTGKVGVRWKPTKTLLLRGAWAEGFRAPSIGELFGGATRLDAAISDPCANFLDTNVGQSIVDACIAEGVPADGSYTQFGGQISVQTGGNEALVPETSQSYAVTVAWQPDLDADWIDSLQIEVTRYDHLIEDAITGYDAQTVLDGCYRHRASALCDLVTRNERGGIAAFRNTLFNVGSIQTDGWDIGIAFMYSNWSVDWNATYLSDYTESLRDSTGTVIERVSLAGSTQSDRGKPEWKSSAAVNWTQERFQVSWTARYIDAMTERCSDFLDGSPDSLTNLGLCSMPNRDDNTKSRNKLASVFYHDIQGSYDLRAENDNATITIGVNNILDRDPPISQSASLNGYDASVYDIPGGRFAYLEISYQL